MDALDRALAGQSEQGSPLWQDIRVGRFTSSEMHRLVKVGERLMTPEELASRPKSGPGSKSKWTEDPSKLSDDGETYVYEKVAEVLTGMPKPQPRGFALEWGDEMEPHAAEEFVKRSGYSMEIVAFVPFGDHAGGSPDRYVNGDEGLEIKCPYNPVNQVKYLMYSDQWDLKRNHPDYYWQIMSNLLWTGKKRWNFVTYDHRFSDPKHQMSWIKIEPHAGDMQIITDRVAAAVKLKLEILNSLK